MLWLMKFDSVHFAMLLLSTIHENLLTFEPTVRLNVFRVRFLHTRQAKVSFSRDWVKFQLSFLCVILLLAA